MVLRPKPRKQNLIFLYQSIGVFNSRPLVEGLHEIGKRVAQSITLPRVLIVKNVLSRKINAFDIVDYAAEYDDRYHCKNCADDFI